jgi:hypothetical protein
MSSRISVLDIDTCREDTGRHYGEQEISGLDGRRSKRRRRPEMPKYS